MATMELVLSGVGVVIALLFLVYWQIRVWYIPMVPHHKQHWLLGALPVISKNYHRLFDLFLDFHKEMGRSYQGCLPGLKPEINLAPSEENLRHVLKDAFHKYILPVSRIEVLQEFIGQGIFASDGPTWQGQRKAASHIFTMRALRESMSEEFDVHGRKVIKILEGHGPDQYFDIQAIFFKYTMDTFAKIAFGANLNTLEQDFVPFANSFDEAQMMCLKRFLEPWWRVEQKLRLPFGREGRLRRHMKIIDSFVSDLIHRRRTEWEASSRDSDRPANTDLVSHFLHAAHAAGENMSDTELRDIVMNFLLAGRDTTACALTWFFYEMNENPEVEQKVIREVDEARASCGSVFQASEHMPYTEACFLETLRLHPSVPMDGKQAVEDDVLPDGTPVPAGITVSYLPYVFGRSTSLWGPDAMTFNPERWLGPDVPSQYKFPSFNAGPRICLGKALAILEAKMLINMILSRFHVRLDRTREVTYRVTITLSVKDGLFVRAIPRQS